MVEIVLYVIFVSLRAVKILRKVIERISTSVIGSFLFFDDYFEGTSYGFERTDDFALGTPPGALAALFCLDKSYHIINQHQGITGAHADAQPTSVALFLVYHRYFSQRNSLRFLASLF